MLVTGMVLVARMVLVVALVLLVVLVALGVLEVVLAVLVLGVAGDADLLFLGGGAGAGDVGGVCVSEKVSVCVRVRESVCVCMDMNKCFCTAAPCHCVCIDMRMCSRYFQQVPVRVRRTEAQSCGCTAGPCERAVQGRPHMWMCCKHHSFVWACSRVPGLST